MLTHSFLGGEGYVCLDRGEMGGTLRNVICIRWREYGYLENRSWIEELPREDNVEGWKEVIEGYEVEHPT